MTKLCSSAWPYLELGTRLVGVVVVHMLAVASSRSLNPASSTLGTYSLKTYEPFHFSRL